MLQLCLPGSLLGTQGQDPFTGPGAHLELSVPLGLQQNVPIGLAALCGYSFAVPRGKHSGQIPVVAGPLTAAKVQGNS